MEFTPLKDLWNFLHYPTPRKYGERVPSAFLYVNILFIAAFFINFFVLLIISSMVNEPSELGGAFDGLDLSLWQMIGIGVVGAPLVEELVFRLPLRNKVALSILVSFLISVIAGVILKGQGLTDLINYVLPILFSMILLPLLYSKVAWEKWKPYLDSLYPYIFFLTAAIFGLIHIYNYNESAYSWWMVPILIMPQFILALFLGFVRLRIGLWACIYMHAMNNLISILLVFKVSQLVDG